MSEKDHRVLLGRIVGAHGIRGEVAIESYTAEPTDIAAYGPLETEDGSRRLDVRIVRVASKGPIARIGGIGDRTGAEALKGLKLYVDRNRLPAVEGDEFYHADLIGLHAENPSGTIIGTVVAIQNYGAGDLLEVQLLDTKKTELIPFKEPFVPKVDIDAGRVVIDMPAAEPDKKS